MASVAKKLTSSNRIQQAVAVMRLGIGFIFLWAFVDKLLGLTFATARESSWLNGASPTTGFLANVSGPFEGLFQNLAGVAVVDWLFMLGLLGVGLALILGAGVRVAVVAGSLLLFFMYLAALPLSTNPLIDDHIIYILALAVVGYSVPVQAWSIAGWWRKLSFVKNRSYLW